MDNIRDYKKLYDNNIYYVIIKEMVIVKKFTLVEYTENFVNVKEFIKWYRRFIIF